MKISPINGINGITGITGITGSRIAGTDSPPHGGPAPATAASAAPSATPASAGISTATQAAPPLQSAVLQPALAALRALPDGAIDQARVSALRDALAAGALPFDAAKLAGLIQRFHGGRP